MTDEANKNTPLEATMGSVRFNYYSTNIYMQPARPYLDRLSTLEITTNTANSKRSVRTYDRTSQSIYTGSTRQRKRDCFGSTFEFGLRLLIYSLTHWILKNCATYERILFVHKISLPRTSPWSSGKALNTFQKSFQNRLFLDSLLVLWGQK